MEGTEVTDTDRPTDPHGSEPPSEPEPNGSHLLTAIGNLIDSKLGVNSPIEKRLASLDQTSADAQTTSAQTAAEVRRLRADFDFWFDEVLKLKEKDRLQDLEIAKLNARVNVLEGKNSDPPSGAE